jgi:hypothetical protein
VARERAPVDEVEPGSDRTDHRQAQDADPVRLEAREVGLEVGLAQRGRRDVDLEPARALAERDVDEVAAGAADRRLHHVQYVHRRRFACGEGLDGSGARPRAARSGGRA